MKYFGFLAVIVMMLLACPATSSPLAKSKEVWLRFHEAELCQGLDAVFVFNDKGMEIWSVVEDEKSYQKLLELVAPLRSSQEIFLYVTRPVPEKKSPEDRDPPPSLWNNLEVRSYFQDSKETGAGGFTVRPKTQGDPDYLLKQRIMMFAEQTLELDKKMKRYTADLAELAETAFGAGTGPELKGRAAATCMAHAQAINKAAERLMENLTIALPKASKRFPERSEQNKPRLAGSALAESTVSLAGATQSIARRIYRFIHPENHTVGLVDLREPSLLESLKTLRKMTDDFNRAAQAARFR